MTVLSRRLGRAVLAGALAASAITVAAVGARFASADTGAACTATYAIGWQTPSDSPPDFGVTVTVTNKSLTNVVKHAGASAASVRVRVGDGRAVEVEVRDDGCGAAGCGAGFGIRGMRERTESTGGVLAAGPLPEGGYAVRTVWPARP